MTDLKTTAGKIEDLDAKLAESRAPLGEGEPAARTRVTQLLDEGSFVETDALAATALPTSVASMTAPILMA
nr:hypothetical protein [Corynebacterium tuberculostearicum]